MSQSTDLTERASQQAWGAIRPHLTQFERALDDEPRTAMAKADLLAIDIAESVLAAIGGPK